MLTELYSIMVILLPVIGFCAFISKTIDIRNDREIKMHSAVHELFFYDRCSGAASCSKSQIRIKDLYEIKIRKPSKAFKNKEMEERKDEVLNELYQNLEEAAKGGIDQ